jgi:hypothetical protein
MMPTWLLQYDNWFNGNVFQALISPFVDLLGVPLVAMYVFGVVGVGYYTVQQSVIIPIVMLILVGGITIGFAPATATQLVVAAVAVGLTSIGYLAFQRARTGV